MSSTWLLNLLLAAVALAGAARLAATLGEPPAALPEAPAVIRQSSPADGPVADRPEQDADYEVIVARDLFSPSRGPTPAAPVPVSLPVAPKPPARPKITLFGVVIVDGERSAFLQEGGGDARPKRIQEGESFAGGTVKAIRPDGVTLSFAGVESVVPLRAPKEGLAPLPAMREPQSVPPTPAIPGLPGRMQTGAAVRGAQPATPLRQPPQLRRFAVPADRDEEFFEEDEGLAEEDYDEDFDEDFEEDFEEDYEEDFEEDFEEGPVR